ncbi:hypothetical protein LguiA_033638 [Lonicera macranthoides]
MEKLWCSLSHVCSKFGFSSSKRLVGLELSIVSFIIIYLYYILNPSLVCT